MLGGAWPLDFGRPVAGHDARESALKPGAQALSCRLDRWSSFPVGGSSFPVVCRQPVRYTAQV